MDLNCLDIETYQKLPQIVIGFHGCDKSIADKVLCDPLTHLTPSKNGYDWLGDGIYFWLNDPHRAYEWAKQTQKRDPNKIKQPYVIGAIIDLGMCLNFCERSAIKLLQKSYEDLADALKKLDIDIKTELINKTPDEGGFNLIRPLDAAIINNLHKMSAPQKIEFDTVYGYFQEGKDAYFGAGVREKTHIQVCVRNLNCIKGYFLPRYKQSPTER